MAPTYRRGTGVGSATVRPPRRVGITVVDDDSGRGRSILESEGVSFEADDAAPVAFTVNLPVEDCERVLDRVRCGAAGLARIDR